jgi:anaerobic magnesium-protoporphyrin IX monomethyl ester cyclase
MRDAGLYMIYMGLESGDAQGLVTLNKEISVDQNLAAVRMLKDLGIRFEYGFMLLDPSSTFASVRTNVEFLRQIIGDGCAAATFCKMLPYDGTPIKDALAASGRLKGDVCAPDYDFLDPKLDAFYADLAQVVEVTGWVHGPQALTLQLGWAHTEVAVIRKLFPRLPDTDAYDATLRRRTAESNAALLRVVEQLADFHEAGVGRRPDPQQLRRLCAQTLETVVNERNAFITRHQRVLLDALDAAAA